MALQLLTRKKEGLVGVLKYLKHAGERSRSKRRLPNKAAEAVGE